MANETNNLIPSINASGRFVALAPFDKVVVESTFYTVEALRTISEMQAMRLNLYELLFAPIGVSETDYPAILEAARAASSVIVTLTSRLGVPVYVLSTYFKSFPEVDGVAYENMCLIANLGPCHPTMKDTIGQAQEHFRQYLKNFFGIDADVRLGSIPTIGYVSAAQAEAYENTRKGLITDTTNDIATIKSLKDQLVEKDTYIAQLEANNQALSAAATPTP